MSDFIKINGTAIRTTGQYRRHVTSDEGDRVEELEIVVIIRGSMATRQFKHLLSAELLRIDIPMRDAWDSWEATLHAANAQSSGSDESSVHRFDLVLRETSASAARRRELELAAPAPEPEPKPVKPPLEPELDEASADLSTVQVKTDAKVWATALKQMKEPPGKHVAPEPPLTALELAGIEAVLTNLRLDAVIDLLEASGRIRRTDVDARFRRLVQKRFVSEATPVVGEKAAKRAERDLLG